MEERVRKQIAVVTGGNKGIGFEIARMCAAQGFHVILTSRDESRGKEAAKKIGCEFAILDLNDVESIQRCAHAIHAHCGAVDILINNASMAFKFSDQTPWTQKVRATVQTNFFGTLAVCNAFAPILRDGGRIITVASGSGHLNILRSEGLYQEFESADTTLTVERLVHLMAQFIADVEEVPSKSSTPSPSSKHAARGWPDHAYGMSKLAQVALTKVLARDLAPRGVVVNCYDPGACKTDMSSNRGSRTAAQGADTAVWLAKLPARAAAGRFFRDRAAIVW